MNKKDLFIAWSFSEYADGNITYTVLPDVDYFREEYKGRILANITVDIPPRDLVIKHGLGSYEKELANIHKRGMEVREKIQNLLALPAPSPDVSAPDAPDVLDAETLPETEMVDEDHLYQETDFDDDVPF